MGTSYQLQMRLRIAPDAEPAFRRDLDQIVAAANGQVADAWRSGHRLSEHSDFFRDPVEDIRVLIGPYFDHDVSAHIPGIEDARGVMVADDVLLIGIAPYNGGHDVGCFDANGSYAGKAGVTFFDVLFDFLAKVSADVPGTVCGRYWVEGYETAGPIVRTSDGFVAAFSIVQHPADRVDRWGVAPQGLLAPQVVPLDSIRRCYDDAYLVGFDMAAIRPLCTPVVTPPLRD